MPHKKILIADDHSAIRKGIKLIISAEFVNVEFAEAVNANEVFAEISRTTFDIIILDVDMPGRNGLEILKQLRDSKFTTPVLVFTMHREDLIALRAFKLGAAGYITKDSADTELLKALNLLFQGRKYISPAAAELMAASLENPEEKVAHELLSDRELQTFILIASGKSVAEIAEHLSLSIPTVSTYRARIMEKTRLKNNAEIAAYAVRNQLI